MRGRWFVGVTPTAACLELEGQRHSGDTLATLAKRNGLSVERTRQVLARLSWIREKQLLRLHDLSDICQ
jgi:hypothetical protein